jgi:hypothetical protein
LIVKIRRVQGKVLILQRFESDFESAFGCDFEYWAGGFTLISLSEYTEIWVACGSMVEALCYKPEGCGFDS